jgi:Flp pilus assembly protein TadD
MEDSHDGTHHLYAQALALKGDIEGQVREEKKAIELNDHNIDARLALAMAYTQHGEHDKAVAELNAVLKLEPGNKDAQNFLAKLAASPSAPVSR